MFKMFSISTLSFCENASREMVQLPNHGVGLHKQPCGTHPTHRGRSRKKKRSKPQLEDPASMVEERHRFVVEILGFSHADSPVVGLCE